MIAVLGALRQEVSAVVSEIEESRSSKWYGREIYEGYISGKKCVVTWTGVGKVFSAMVSQYVIDAYHPDKVIFIGIAGSVMPNLRIGDLVIAEDCVFYDIDVTVFGFKPGEFPSPSLPTEKKMQWKNETMRFFPSDTKLLQKAGSFSGSGFRIFTGRICTGDSYVSAELRTDNRRTDNFIKELECLVVEMEGAAAAQVCSVNNVPFILIRVVSDTPEGGQTPSFRKFISESSEKLMRFVLHLIS